MMIHNNELIKKTTLYAPHNNYEDLIAQIQNFMNLSFLPINIVFFISTKYVFKSFENIKDNQFQIEKVYFQNDIFIGKLSRTYGRSIKKKVSGKFLLFKHNFYDVFLAVTEEGTDFFENGLFKYIKSLYPIFTLPFFYSWEIEEMLNNLSKRSLIQRIMLTRISKKSRILAKGARKSRESDIQWTDMPYKDVFTQARETDSWIQKIYLDLLNERNSKVLSGFISRDGAFKCERNFKLFYETIIETGAEIFINRKKKLSNRARIKKSNYKAKPFFVEFDYPVFENKDQNIKLIECIRKLSHSTNSVIHSNPYLHAIITDYIDNSNFDLWVLSDKRITIVPQTICTMSSLNRFNDHLSREFKEGEIKEFE